MRKIVTTKMARERAIEVARLKAEGKTFDELVVMFKLCKSRLRAIEAMGRRLLGKGGTT